MLFESREMRIAFQRSACHWFNARLTFHDGTFKQKSSPRSNFLIKTLFRITDANNC